MTFPLINKIYIHPSMPNNKVIVWGQDLFFNVYLRTIPNHAEDMSTFIKMNWWRFMFGATYTGYHIDENNKLC